MLDQLIGNEKPPYAIAMIVNRIAPSSGKPGDKAVILPDGTMKGWIGGGCTRGIVLKEALLAIDQGKPRLVTIAPGAEDITRKGVVAYTMTCESGGSVEVYIEPVLPKPHILIMGRSHIGMALSRLSKLTGYQVSVVAKGADRITFTDADRVLDTEVLEKNLISDNTYIVVCTQGENDDMALKQAIESGAKYVSFVSSVRKANSIYNSLKKKGISVQDLARVKTPAGIDISAKLPEEVAISILAEIISILRNEKGADKKDPTSSLNLDEYFINPVCNIPIQKSTAKHIIPYKGIDYFFCCDGCTDSFKTDPEKYAIKEK
ncbi:MAG TPA: XdhC family protein [Cyclobacteriaceae bacterium]